MNWRKFRNYIDALICREDSSYRKMAYRESEIVDMASDEEMMLELGLDPTALIE
jgi:hypothetical protein